MQGGKQTKNGLPGPVPEGETKVKLVEHIGHGQLIGHDYVSISAQFCRHPEQRRRDWTMPAKVCWEGICSGVWKEVDELACEIAVDD
jgi:hypothetical protein